MPIVWISGFIIASVISKSSRKRKKRIIIAMILLLFFSNGFIGNELFRLWEYDSTKFVDTPKATYGIILSGFTNIQTDDDDRVYFNKGADRLLHTVYLYKLGKIDSIIVTGGTVRVWPTEEKIKTEAERIGEVLALCGIPKDKIILETQARNTHENAVLTSPIVKKNPCLLITSAFHMKRAIGCFQKEKVNFTPFAVDYYSTKRTYAFNYLLIPSEVTLANWARLIHEIVGYIAYSLVGYL